MYIYTDVLTRSLPSRRPTICFSSRKDSSPYGSGGLVTMNIHTTRGATMTFVLLHIFVKSCCQCSWMLVAHFRLLSHPQTTQFLHSGGMVRSATWRRHCRCCRCRSAVDVCSDRKAFDSDGDDAIYCAWFSFTRKFLHKTAHNLFTFWFAAHIAYFCCGHCRRLRQWIPVAIYYTRTDMVGARYMDLSH